MRRSARKNAGGRLAWRAIAETAAVHNRENLAMTARRAQTFD
jgi:hypothetical protein